MRASTRQLLDSLESIRWFHSVRKPNLEMMDGAVFVLTWKKAIETCSAESWQEMRTDKDNAICEQLPKERMNQWNTLVGHLKPEIKELAANKVAESEEAIPNTTEVINTASWDLLRACMECEYDDVLFTRFYRDVADWYLRGHFPCGYQEIGERGVHIVL